jgi:malate/lactate dehydrogenase
MQSIFNVIQNVCNQLALVDKAADKLRGEAMDLEQGSVFSNCKVTFSTGEFVFWNEAHTFDHPKIGPF